MARREGERVPRISRGAGLGAPSRFPELNQPGDDAPIIVPGNSNRYFAAVADPANPDVSGRAASGRDVAQTGSIPAVVPGVHTKALSASIFTETEEPSETQPRVIDDPIPRLRKPRNVLGIVLCLLGVAAVILISYFAPGTTGALGSDLSGFGDILYNILAVPAGWLQGLVAWVLPVAVLIELLVRRMPRLLLESAGGLIAGLILGVLTFQLIRNFGTGSLLDSLSIRLPAPAGVVTYHFDIPFMVSALVGLLTVAGPRQRRKTVGWSWRLLWITLLLLLFLNNVSLPAAIIALFVGRIGGLLVQWATGVRSERAYGDSLVDAVRRAGFHPTALVRVSDLGEATRWENLTTPEDTVPLRRSDLHAYEAAVAAGLVPDPTAKAPSILPGGLLAGGTLPGAGDPVTRSSDSAAVALARAGDNRVYAMLNQDGARYDVVVLDGDRQVVGFLTRMWRSLRLRGIEGRATISLKAVAERTALLCYAATSAGVRTPRLLGMGMSADSAALVLSHARGAVSFRDLTDADFEGASGDRIMAESWKQLLRAHTAGLSHHQITPDVLLVHRDDAGQPHVWVSGWEQGEVASSTLAKRMDLTQMLALLALRVGATRAVSSAASALPADEISALGPLMQSVALPSSTRQAIRERKGLMAELRDELVKRTPEAAASAPQRITRFGARTVFMTVAAVFILILLVTTFSFEDIRNAIMAANLWWLLAAAGFSALTWLGAALTLKAFSPAEVPLRKSLLVQMAGSFVAIATPAGIGPAALNLRFLNRRGVSTPLAVATVALVQVSQIVVTVFLLLVLSLGFGAGGLVATPPREVMIAIVVVLAIVGVLLLVAPVRRWAWARIQPTIAQVWPRLSQMLETPSRLALGITGNVTMTVGNVMAFMATLQAFGHHLPLLTIAVTYLVGNTAGALLPLPGGIGGVDTALTTGLMPHIGVAAVPVTVIFRLITFWARIPIGWFAMKRLERNGDM